MDKLSRFITKLLSLAIILLALIVIGLRIGLSNIDFFKSDIEIWLAKDVTPGISFSSIQGSWNQLNPILKLNDASITLPDRRQTTTISSLSVEFDIWRSLLLKSPVVREVTGMINKLSLRKDSAQQWWLNEISLGSTSAKEKKSDIGQLIAQIPHYLHLEINRLIIFDQSSGEKYQIGDIKVDTQQRDGTYYLQLNASLPEALGNNLEVKSIISEENSLAYLKSDRLELDRLASLFGLNIGGVMQAEIGGEVWINFLNNKTLAMNGNLSINQGLFQPREGGELRPFSLNSQISIFQLEGQWNISNRFERLSVDFLPLNGFETELRVTMEAGQPRTIEGWVKEFELFNLRALDEQLIPAKIADALIQGELRGVLKNATTERTSTWPGPCRCTLISSCCSSTF